MDAVLARLVELTGGGVAVALLLYMTRGAIAVALDQAAKLEIEKYRSDFARELERERAAFSRELERERQEASRALEQFKVELTTGAEVRRQVATRRVDALDQILARGDDLFTAMLSVSSSYPVDIASPSRRELWDRVLQFGTLVRSKAHLFDQKTEAGFHEFSKTLLNADADMTYGSGAAAFTPARLGYEAFKELVRTELGIDWKKGGTL